MRDNDLGQAAPESNPRPHFLPPVVRLIKPDTMDGIRRALPILGWAIAHQRISLSVAHDILLVSFIRHIWDGKNMRRLNVVSARVLDRLDDFSARMDRMAEEAEE